MKILELARQLSRLTADCADYALLQTEICALLGGYTDAVVSLDNGKAMGSEHGLALRVSEQDILNLQRNAPFTAEEEAMAEMCLPIFILLHRRQKEQEQAKQQRQVQMIRTALNTLSFTELEVVLHIFQALGGREGTLIAGKIADGLGFTRSVVVSALRKLESARIIETRSLGVKGTHIRVLNGLWWDELKKFRR